VCLYVLLLFGVYDVVFFFQAEDGIRDFHVTGVQTCALPISAEAARKARHDRTQHARSSTPVPGLRFSPHGQHAVDRQVGTAVRRSEERRVGKEGGSRWSRWHKYKRRARCVL